MQKYDLEIEIDCPGIGDLLTYTPIFKHYKNCLVKMIDNEKGRRNSKLYDGLCSVVFDKNAGDNLKGDVPYLTHTAARRLIQIGLTNISPIPEIIVTENEIENGKKILTENNIDINKPMIAIIADAHNSNLPDNFGEVRLMSIDRWSLILYKLSQKYQLIQFGLSSNATKLPFVHKQILDLSIRDLASCYKIVQKYVGVDTGDYHLMIATGGKSAVFTPKTGEGGRHTYLQWKWYYQDCWYENNEIRSKYFYKNFELSELKDIINELEIFLN